MITKESLERTDETTGFGQPLFRDGVTGKMYYEDALGELKEHKVSQMVQSNSADISGIFFIGVIGASAAIGLWMKNNMNDTLFSYLFTGLIVLFIVLPFANKFAKRLVKVTNLILLASSYIYLTSNIDEITSASNSSFVYLGLFINACIAGVILYMGYKILRKIQKKVLNA